MLLADTTTYGGYGGYVITAGLGLISAYLLAERQWNRKEIARQNEALANLQQSSAILLAALPQTNLRLEGLEGRTRTLEITTAVLSDAINRHETWHATQREHHP